MSLNSVQFELICFLLSSHDHLCLLFLLSNSAKRQLRHFNGPVALWSPSDCSTVKSAGSSESATNLFSPFLSSPQDLTELYSFTSSQLPGGSVVKSLPAMQETRVQSLGWEDPLEKEMTAHPSILAWEIPWTEEPGRLQSTRSQKNWTWLRN